jgi:probable HAF family extracellular repeat protein
VRGAALAVAVVAAATVTTATAPVGASVGDRPPGPVPGFVFRDGGYTPFDSPGPDVAIFPSGINDQGEIVGEYMRADGESGFVRDARGRITAFDIPGAQGTEAVKINDLGEVVGRYSQDTPFVEDSGSVRGYVRRGARVTLLDVPGATATRPAGINDQGHVVGTYVDAGGATHGFLWREGRFTTIDLRGATAPTPVDINDRGDILGLYVDAAGATFGFLLSDEKYTTIAVAGAATTIPTGINDGGQIVGYTADDAGLTGARGILLADGVDGAATPIEVPEADGSVALGINDQGHVVGLHGIADETSDAPDAPYGSGQTPPPAMQPPEMPAGPDRQADGDPEADGDPSSAAEWVTVRGITVNAAIADEIDSLLAAAEADGLRLTGGGYRSRERQIELRRANCGTSDYAIYEMPSSQCSPPTARPGMSMHERGLAIDFNCDGELIRSRSNACYGWLADKAATFGLYNLPSEPWHWSTNGS